MVVNMRHFGLVPVILCALNIFRPVVGDVYDDYVSNDPTREWVEPPHPSRDAPKAAKYYGNVPQDPELFSPASKMPCRSSSAQETGYDDPWGCDRALDGYTEICFGSEVGDVVPWWVVDLEDPMGVAQIEIYTTDLWGYDDPGYVDIFVGTEEDTWMTSIKCAQQVSMKPLFYDFSGVEGLDGMTKEPAPIKVSCGVAGRYVWIVGQKNKRLVMCEVKTRVRGPDGFKIVRGVVGNMFNIDLTGIQFTDFDRISIVDSTIPCGSAESNIMNENVVSVSSPEGPADYINTEDQSSASWRNIRMTRMGFYRLCWCGEACDLGGEYYSREGGIIVVNGILRSEIGDPYAFMVGNEIAADTAFLDTPTCLSTSGNYLFICEKGRVRYVDLTTGVINTLVGQMEDSWPEAKPVSVRFFFVMTTLMIN